MIFRRLAAREIRSHLLEIYSLERDDASTTLAV